MPNTVLGTLEGFLGVSISELRTDKWKRIICSFIHSLTHYLLSFYYVPDTMEELRIESKHTQEIQSVVSAVEN